MRTARLITSGEDFGDLRMLAPLSIEGTSSNSRAVQPGSRVIVERLTNQETERAAPKRPAHAPSCVLACRGLAKFPAQCFILLDSNELALNGSGRQP
jgi:hypothetical protein